MIPLWMKMIIREEGKKGVHLYIPIFLAWILLLAISLLLLPFIIIFAIIFWRSGYGKIILALLPYLWSVLWSLSGLKIDISEPGKEFYFVFK